jgi:hypothetical protein
MLTDIFTEVLSACICRASDSQFALLSSVLLSGMMKLTVDAADVSKRFFISIML